MSSNAPLNFALSGILAFPLFLSCSKKEGAGLLPQSLQQLPLDMQLSGAEAKARIASLHGKEAPPVESYIGYYGSGENHATLYISKFDSKEHAQKMLKQMLTNIGRGNSGFGRHKLFNVNNRKIHLVPGPGQIHYFFGKDKYLYWLVVSPEMARAALAQLLQVNVQAVPVFK